MDSDLSARELIEEIQREVFLHEEDLAFREQNPDTKETKRQLQTIRRLEGTLELFRPTLLAKLTNRISKHLYTDITHFILELIQNGDDNTYPAGVRPTLNINLSRRNLVVKCNEVGFTAENVRAICDINGSTKKARKSIEDGCIGEKGIGTVLSDWALVT